MKVKVIDIQGFIVRGEFEPKELVISDGKEYYHFLFQHSLPINQLSSSNLSNMHWLEHCYTHLKYSEGYIPQNQIYNILKKHLEDTALVCVKGAQKFKYVSHILGDIVNIVDLTLAPKLEESSDRCIYHTSNDNLKSHCALVNAKILCKYLNL